MNAERFDMLLRLTERDGIENLIDFLHKTDFYRAPASTKFHSSYEGGLLQHSLNVFDMLSLKCSNKPWSDIGIKQESIIIVSLLHDICKIQTYKPSLRNVKDENGKWKQVPYYEVEDKYPYGHGEKSAMIAERYISLSSAERYAIRWHMGFAEPKENYKYVGAAMDMYPLVFLLHEADNEATHYLEGKDENIRNI